MIIVLEGPDGAGKSTLAEMFTRRHDAHVIHLGSRHAKRAYLYNWAVLEKAIKLHMEGKMVVLDRMWLSEHVYGSVFRPGDAKIDLGRLMHRVLLTYGAIHIVCTGPTDELVKHQRANLDPDHPYDDEPFRRVCELYRWSSGMHEQMVPISGVNTPADTACVESFSQTYAGSLARHSRNMKLAPYPWCYRYDRFNQEHFGMDSLHHYADYMRLVASNHSRTPMFHKTREFCGSVGGRLLLVGDQINQRTNRRPWPFFSNRYSSFYLSDVLNRHDISEDQLWWINSTNPEVVRAVTERAVMFNMQIVLLGKNAEKQFIDANKTLAADLRARLPHLARATHHPQYPYRFPKHRPDFEMALVEAHRKGVIHQ